MKLIRLTCPACRRPHAATEYGHRPACPFCGAPTLHEITCETVVRTLPTGVVQATARLERAA